jgi:hypothetical protein
MADVEASGLPGKDSIDILTTTLHEYLFVIRFIFLDTARDPTFNPNHLLSYLADDFVQSALSIISLARQGGASAAMR